MPAGHVRKRARWRRQPGASGDRACAPSLSRAPRFGHAGHARRPPSCSWCCGTRPQTSTSRQRCSARSSASTALWGSGYPAGRPVVGSLYPYTRVEGSRAPDILKPATRSKRPRERCSAAMSCSSVTWSRGTRKSSAACATCPPQEHAGGAGSALTSMIALLHLLDGRPHLIRACSYYFRPCVLPRECLATYSCTCQHGTMCVQPMLKVSCPCAWSLGWDDHCVRPACQRPAGSATSCPSGVPRFCIRMSSLALGHGLNAKEGFLWCLASMTNMAVGAAPPALPAKQPCIGVSQM